MKYLKKTLSFFLAAVLLALSCSAAFAAPAEDCPTVYVHGYMGTPLLADRNDPNSDVIWSPDMDAILNDVKNALPSVLAALTARNWNTLGDLLLGVVTPYFTPVYYADNGTPGNTSGVWFVYPTVVTPKSSVVFRYDWREDPLKTAEDLNSFIEYVCETAGVSQVKVRAHSYGGTVLVTYLTLHGNERMRSVALDSTAIFGESYTGDLMKGLLSLDVNGLENYLRYAFAGSEYEAIISKLLNAARRIGLTKQLVRLGDQIIENLQERVMREMMLPMFGNWLSVWSMIPDEDVEESVHFVFDELCKDQDRSALREKVDAYNTLIRPYKTQTLQALNESANVYVISRTGFSSLPITPSQGNLGDGTVDTKYSSFGATTALYGEQLPKSVLDETDAAYISPEKDISAATCLFPEQTWFVRGIKHSSTDDVMEEFEQMLLDEPEQATVSTFAAYPRFLAYDAATGLSPDTGTATASTGVEQAQSVLSRLKAFFTELKQLLNLLLQKLKLK